MDPHLVMFVTIRFQFQYRVFVFSCQAPRYIFHSSTQRFVQFVYLFAFYLPFFLSVCFLDWLL